MERLTLCSLHTINATMWLALGVFMVILGDDGTPLENTWETFGALLIFTSLVVKVVLWLVSFPGVFPRLRRR